MHPRFYAARELEARNKLVSASQKLAAGLGMTELADAIANARHKDPKIAYLYREEAVANFVTALADSFRVIGPAQTEESFLKRLEGLELSKTSMEKIRKEFGVTEKPSEDSKSEDGDGQQSDEEPQE